MFKLISILFASLFVLGCSSTGHRAPIYNQSSPMIDTVKNSGYTSNSRREEGSVRYDPYTTLGSNVKQAGEVMITVTFDYQQSRNRNAEPRTSKCLLHIKSSDRSLADVRKCSIMPSAGTFIVSFTTGGQGYQSFDLFALGGHWVGQAPPYRPNFYFYLGDPNKRANFRYDYIGQDPFK